MEQLLKPTSSNLSKVLNYGNQISVVLHNHSINRGGRGPRDFDAQLNILDASNSTLRQLLELVKKELAGKKIFSEKGLEYVNTLAVESARELVKIEGIVEDGCLSSKELSAKKKEEKKALGLGKGKKGKKGKGKGKGKKAVVEKEKKEEKVFIIETDLPDELDGAKFLEKVEATRWGNVNPPLRKVMQRLYDVQTHMLLISQVLTLGSLTKDMSSNQADIRTIANYHDRIGRTADLLYLRLPSRYLESSDSSDVDSIRIYSSDSDSDVSSIASFRARQTKRKSSCPPPPPPPPPPANNSPVVMCGQGPPPFPATTIPVPVVDNANPPSYSESPTATPAVSNATKDSFPDEKKEVKKEEVRKEVTVKEEEPKPIIPEARLFKSRSIGLKFKIKSLFRSNQSLAEEMKRTLNDTESHLSAWVIRNYDFRPVPHSAFHSLEATHMKTILSQLNSDDWYKTFVDLSPMEHNCIDNIINPGLLLNKDAITKINREIIVLKVVQQSKQAAWMALLREILRRYPAPPGVNSRVLLAIVREKLVDGEPSRSTKFNILPPPPPPPPTNWPAAQPAIPAMRPPPALTQPVQRSRISDLSTPYFAPAPPPFPRGPMRPPPPPANWGHVPPPPPPANPNSNFNNINPNAQPLVKSESVRIIDTTPLTDSDAVAALTTFSTYTLRLTDPLSPNQPRTWARVAVTQESAEKHTILKRVADFERSGGDVIEIKLRLTENQSAQVTRLLDDIKLGERDNRFEWCCVEISGCNQDGDIKLDGDGDGGSNFGTATVLHITMKRIPRASQRPMELYNALMNRPVPWNGPRPPIGPPPIMKPAPPRMSRPKSIDSGRSSSSSGSDSDSDSDSDESGSESGYSSYSSIGDMRMKLRRRKSRAYKAMVKKGKKEEERREKRLKKGKVDGSDDEEEVKVEEVKDKIEIKLDLKRGDDVVKVLLGMWTALEEKK